MSHRLSIILVPLLVLVFVAPMGAQSAPDHCPRGLERQGRCTSAPDPVDDPAPDPMEEPVPDPVDEPAPDPGPGEVADPADDVTEVTGTQNGFVVPAGETWEIKGTVESDANVVVEGTLKMRPGATLRFVGVDESKFVGGHTHMPLANDVGLWVVNDGVLDAQGTPKTGWNRSGTDPTWSQDDELVVAPMTPGDYQTFPAFTAGSTVPFVTDPDGGAHRAEVANLTRDVRIEGGGSNSSDVLQNGGRAHVIFLHVTQPQTIKHVELRWMGPRAFNDHHGSVGVLGRYPLHFHMSEDGTQGTVVEGVVVRDAGNSAFVPHESHGITFTDTVAFNTFETPYWWDPDTETNDLVYDRAAAMKTIAFPAARGYKMPSFLLGEGTNMTVRDSVAVGNGGRTHNAGGFQWPKEAAGRNNLWTFENNVAHNNRDVGLSGWQNDANPHVVGRFIGFNNQRGLNHGAYRNSFNYHDALLFDNTTDFVLEALAAKHGPDARFERLRIHGDLRIAPHRQPSAHAVRFFDTLIGGKIVVDEGSDNGGTIIFSSSDPEFDLTRDDFEVRSLISDILVNNSDGTSFHVN